MPSKIHKIKPHPYMSLGAPYGNGIDPWRLRVEVIRRLLLAEEYLRLEHSQLRVAVFDAWRPISVQEFMIDYSINEQCRLRGVNPHKSLDNSDYQQIVKDVSKFWAPPSLDLNMPPPHSTGGAVDLTLIDLEGKLLDMGGDIDEIGPVSSPEYYGKNVIPYKTNDSSLFHQRRSLLSHVMKQAGFVQHPNEWWHFSYGDQLWAWTKNFPNAIYGVCSGESKSFMA
ncbi:M15 family metallopeptidase [Prochlorococcus sp. MIT 1223]|uniref:M15 family metallopeptidase n=1 Tax=Prochlorococcus sp. MIT 1223 TaxID=3096217 RepID=UPI002A762592|nr:M15 family metallopeptidase [Prochlorococcus sp. MIT 1223]